MDVKKKDGVCRLTQENGKTLAWSEASGVALIEQDGLYFKDLERCGSLLPYEDWRLSDEARAEDLAKRLTLEEIAGLMLYSPHQAVPPQPAGPFGGTYGGKPYAASGEPPYALSDQQKEFMEREHIRHILMITVQDAGTAARWSNALQSYIDGASSAAALEAISKTFRAFYEAGGRSIETLEIYAAGEPVTVGGVAVDCTVLMYGELPVSGVVEEP